MMHTAKDATSGKAALDWSDTRDNTCELDKNGADCPPVFDMNTSSWTPLYPVVPLQPMSLIQSNSTYQHQPLSQQALYALLAKDTLQSPLGSSGSSSANPVTNGYSLPIAGSIGNGTNSDFNQYEVFPPHREEQGPIFQVSTANNYLFSMANDGLDSALAQSPLYDISRRHSADSNLDTSACYSSTPFSLIPHQEILTPFPNENEEQRNMTLHHHRASLPFVHAQDMRNMNRLSTPTWKQNDYQDNTDITVLPAKSTPELASLTPSASPKSQAGVAKKRSMIEMTAVRDDSRLDKTDMLSELFHSSTSTGNPPVETASFKRSKSMHFTPEKPDRAVHLSKGSPYVRMTSDPTPYSTNSPEISNPGAVPRRQKLRYDGDLYTPEWVRYTGQLKEGYCDSCKPGKWLQLKNSAYWYHKQFFHGISSVSGKRFLDPIDQQIGPQDTVEGLCHQCRQYIIICNSKKRNSYVLWYRHAHKCHIYDKPKSIKTTLPKAAATNKSNHIK